MKWISVKETLPAFEEGDFNKYLIFGDGGNFNKATQYIHIGYYNGNGFVNNNNMPFIHMVTHWMPLPEPPQ